MLHMYYALMEVLSLFYNKTIAKYCAFMITNYQSNIRKYIYQEGMKLFSSNSLKIRISVEQLFSGQLD